MSFGWGSPMTRCNPAKRDDDFKAHQKLEFDRYRTAIEIVQHMRKARISCELFIDPREMDSDATAFGQARLRFAASSPCLSRQTS